MSPVTNIDHRVFIHVNMYIKFANIIVLYAYRHALYDRKLQ